jgi:transcriptional regulator with XRE-family HTH domain
VLARRRVIGGRVRDARNALKLTQEQLGEAVGLDRKTVNRIENGTHSPLMDHMLLIADKLRVPLADLVRE